MKKTIKKLCYMCEGLIFIGVGVLMGSMGYKTDSFEFWMILAFLLLLDVVIGMEKELNYTEEYSDKDSEANEND